MEWEPVELKKEEAKPRIRGRMATHELARKEIAEEIARVQGRKRLDPRLEALARAAEAWQRKKDEEELRKRQEEREKASSSIEVVPIKEIKAGAKIEGQPQDLGLAGWLQQGLAQWAEQNQPESKKGEGGRPNSATMAVILRRAVAREKALALGKKLPDPRVVALEQEAARWGKRKEEEGRVIRREIGMLQKLVQLMARDGFFDESKEEEWGIGKVSCFADKVPQNGWNLIVVALEKSQFMVRWGWSDQLGVYQAELDDQLNLKNYIRITLGEVEEYLRERGKDGSKWN